MEALRAVLRDEEWELLTRLGTAEFQVRGLRELLRASGETGRLAQAATSLRYEMDALLADGTGALARALHAFPARTADAGSRAAESALELARRLCIAAEDVNRAASILGSLRGRIEAARRRFGAAVPRIWAAMVDDSVVRQLDLAQTAGTAERLERAVDDIEHSLERQQAQLRAAADRVIAAINAPPRQVAEWRVATLENDEALLELLLRQARDLGMKWIDQGVERVVQSADVHLRHLELKTGGAFVRRPVTRLMAPRRPVLLRWSELDAARRRPASQSKRRKRGRA